MPFQMQKAPTTICIFCDPNVGFATLIQKFNAYFMTHMHVL
jgi:hypothetical protein